jgi:hypothetical protein
MYHCGTPHLEKSLFKSVVLVVNTLNGHFVGAGDQLFFNIDVPIVETIIRKLVFDPDANDETVESALMMLSPWTLLLETRTRLIIAYTSRT